MLEHPPFVDFLPYEVGRRYQSGLTGSCQTTLPPSIVIRTLVCDLHRRDLEQVLVEDDQVGELADLDRTRDPVLVELVGGPHRGHTERLRQREVLLGVSSLRRTCPSLRPARCSRVTATMIWLKGLSGSTGQSLPAARTAPYFIRLRAGYIVLRTSWLM